MGIQEPHKPKCVVQGASQRHQAAQKLEAQVSQPESARLQGHGPAVPAQHEGGVPRHDGKEGEPGAVEARQEEEQDGEAGEEKADEEGKEGGDQGAEGTAQEHVDISQVLTPPPPQIIAGCASKSASSIM